MGNGGGLKIGGMACSPRGWRAGVSVSPRSWSLKAPKSENRQFGIVHHNMSIKEAKGDG